MSLEFLFNNLDQSSKVWVYTAETSLPSALEEKMNQALQGFCADWTAHNKTLKAAHSIIDHRFIILAVDEHLNQSSGCSIDKSVHFVQNLEKEFEISLFNRMLFSYVDEDGNLQTVSIETFEQKIAEGQVNENTMVVNSLVQTLAELKSNFKQPLKESWMNKLFQVA